MAKSALGEEVLGSVLLPDVDLCTMPPHPPPKEGKLDTGDVTAVPKLIVLLVAKVLAFVQPDTNHRSSSATPFHHTRLVVRRGKMPSRKLNRIWHPNRERVPVCFQKETIRCMLRVSVRVSKCERDGRQIA